MGFNEYLSLSRRYYLIVIIRLLVKGRRINPWYKGTLSTLGVRNTMLSPCTLPVKEMEIMDSKKEEDILLAL